MRVQLIAHVYVNQKMQIKHTKIACNCKLKKFNVEKLHVHAQA